MMVKFQINIGGNTNSYIFLSHFLVFLNSLRGFPLKGVTAMVPEHYTGVVFKETQKPLADASDRTFKVDHVFDEFTFWNYDKIPSKNDALHKALDWIKVANVVSLIKIHYKCILLTYVLSQLHEPVNPDDMEEEPDIELKSEETTEN